jgi:CheY-like chemotaxis protein
MDTLRILVVDDNDDAAESLAELLTLNGHDARFVEDAKAALDLLGQFKPEVMLIDLALPEIDGFELARRIRAQQDGANPRLIALTGFGQKDIRDKATAAGFDQFLVKPVTYEKIAAFLKKT